ncbi:MAG: glycosyltransferase [Candidatus Bipolaricaulota bacterium]|nr:glycosyltransferase [Candidatus Bipolaricaulota bacterium]MDW8030972.1 glycosyltransferase [Candidatus Bipolaricaulota bacterium]
MGRALPLVSIIIPCFEQARFVAQAVESALHQDYEPLEVIVVDDGSTDNPLRELRPYLSHPALKYIRQENRGLPQARNRGIQESKGEFLKFLDADDWLDRSAIRKQARVLLEESGFGFVYCDFMVVNEEGIPVGSGGVGQARQLLSGDIFASLLAGGYFTPHTVLIRRSVLEDVGYFDESLGGHADYELWLRVTGAGYRAYYIDESLVYYRLHSSNMSRDWLHMQETRLSALKKIVAMFPERTAESLHYLIQMNEDMRRANYWAADRLQELQAHITRLEQAHKHLEDQRSYWQAEAERREAALHELQRWVSQLITSQQESHSWRKRFYRMLQKTANPIYQWGKQHGAGWILIPLNNLIKKALRIE